MLRILNLLNQLKSIYIGLIGVLVYDFYYAIEPLGGGFVLGVLAAWVYLNGSYFLFKEAETSFRALMDFSLVPLLLLSFIAAMSFDMKLVVIDLAIVELLVFAFALLIFIIIHLGKIAKADFRKEGCAFTVFTLVALGFGGTTIVLVFEKFLGLMTQGSTVLLLVIIAGCIFDTFRKLVLLIRAEKVKKSRQEWKMLIIYNALFGAVCVFYFFIVSA